MKSVGIILGNITSPSGTERAVCNLANILAAEKNQVVIISLYSAKGSCFYRLNDSVKIIHGKFLQNPLKKRFANYFKYPSFINKIVLEEKLDIVFATGHQSNGLLAFVTKKVRRIGCEHMNYESAPFYSRIFRRFTYPFLDAVVCLTKRDASHYSFVKKERLFVIPNSLSFECDVPSDCTTKRIIAVGRLTKQKGFDLLLDSAAIMKESIPDWHLDIFGDGEDKDMLIAKINELQLQNFVSIKNTTPNIQKEFISSSIFLMSSRWEGLSMVLLEAQSCGLPAVSFDCPNGPSDVIVENETGFLVPLYDTRALAEKTIELAKNEELRKRFGRKAQELSSRFSTENIARMWKDALEKVCCQE